MSRLTLLGNLVFGVGGLGEIRKMVIAFLHPIDEYRLRCVEEDETHLKLCVEGLKPARNRYSMLTLLNCMPSVLHQDLRNPLRAYLLQFTCISCHNILCLGARAPLKPAPGSTSLLEHPNVSKAECARCNITRLEFLDGRSVMKRMSRRFQLYLKPCEHRLRAFKFLECTSDLEWYPKKDLLGLLSKKNQITDAICPHCCFLLYHGMKSDAINWTCASGLAVKASSEQYEASIERGFMQAALSCFRADCSVSMEPPRKKLKSATPHSGGLALHPAPA